MGRINAKLANKVADAIEARAIKALGFDMGAWANEITELNRRYIKHPRKDHECKTTACMAGFAALVSRATKSVKELLVLAEQPDIRDPYTGRLSSRVFLVAQEKLGLTHEEAHELFYDTGATDAQAVKALRHMAKTGEVRRPTSFGAR